MLNNIKNKKVLLIKAGILIALFVGGILANQFYKKLKSKEFAGCENYLLDSKTEEITSKIWYLMEAKKYKEVVDLGNKHLKYDGLWYCDNYFWIQRAKAFYNLGNCSQATVAAVHNIFTTPTEARKEAEDLYSSIANSNVCTKFFP